VARDQPQSENGTTDVTQPDLETRQGLLPVAPDLIEHSDVDAYRDALAAWDMQAVPLDRGDFRLRWVVRELPDVSVVRYTTATSIQEHYVKEAGSTAFALVLPGGDGRFRVRGTSLQPLSLTLLQPGMEYEVVSPAGGQALEVYVPDELMSALGLDRWLAPQIIELRPELAAAHQLESTLAPLVTAGLAQLAQPQNERSAVLEALVQALDSVDPSAAPAPTVRLHSVYRRAVAAIESDPDPMLTVAELAARLGVTSRTLRYAFGYALDISPYQYMLRRRLTLVRGSLLDPSRPERTVLELLLAHGITHQGEFAGQYRRLFGETPSQTRAQALARPHRPRSAGSWPRIRRAAF
jgi:AraC-like DNA-binding protein